MAQEKFSRDEAIKFGWEIMKNNIGFFIGVLLVAGLIIYVPSAISKLTEKTHPLVSVITGLVGGILNLIITMGLIKITLKFCDSQKPVFSDLFSCAGLFFNYLFSTLLYALIILGGLILLIVPGIIWAIQFQFFAYFIVEKGCGPIAALKRSSAITKGAKGNLLIFGLLLFLINLAGLLALVVGLFAAIPTTMVATAFVYRRLSAQPGNV